MSAWKKWKRSRSRWRDAYERRESKPAWSPGMLMFDRDFRFPPWVQEWLRPYEERIPPARLTNGRLIAQSGQIATLLWLSGKALATIRLWDRQELELELRFREFTEEEWTAFFDIVAGRADFAVALLAGRMPEGLFERLNEAELFLAPTHQEDFLVKCTCQQTEFPCAHVTGAYYLMADRQARDPFLLFQLRGRDKDAALAGIRAAIGEWEPEAADISPSSDLKRRLGSFFTGNVDAIPAGLPRVSLEPPVLRRLGPVPMYAHDPIVNALQVASLAAGERLKTILAGRFEGRDLTDREVPYWCIPETFDTLT